MDSSNISQFGYQFSNWYVFSIPNKIVLLANLRKDTGVYVIRFSKGNFGRLNGYSDILYIGKTEDKNGIKGRVSGYFNKGPTQFTNIRIYSFLRKQMPMEISFASITQNPRNVEILLKDQYLKDHDELPPFNRNK